MPAVSIHADGIDWPLQTYLDARAFRRVDPFDPPRFDGDLRVEVVTIEGQLHPGYANGVRWHDVLAWRPVDVIACTCCGDPVDQPGEDVCDNCDDTAGWAA